MDRPNSDEFWNTQAPPIEPFVGMRRKAAEIAARYPAVSPDELARASAIVAPQIHELAEERGLRRKRPGRWRGAPWPVRQRVRIHSGVGVDRVRPDIGAGRRAVWSRAFSGSGGEAR